MIWTQEEPKNMGPWVYVSERITTAAQARTVTVVRRACLLRFDTSLHTRTQQLGGRGDIHPEYFGRHTMASPSEGCVRLT